MVAVIVIGCIIAALLIPTLIGKASNAADRAVRHKTYDAGRAEMHRTLTFAAPVSVADLGDRIIAKVNAHDTAPAVAGGLYLEERSASTIVFAVGNKLNTSLRAAVSLSATETGSRGTFEVLNWTESGATVVAKEAVGKMIARITAAVTELGGSATEGGTW